MLTPIDPLIVSVTVFVLGRTYVCATVVALVFVVVPSPNCQKRLVMLPVDVSVKLTVSGANPFIGDALNCATGATAPVPLSAFVALPVSLLTSKAALKLLSFTGAKRTSRLVELKLARLKGMPDIIAKGPCVTLAVPVRSDSPEFVTTKMKLAISPTSKVPKS